MVAAGGDGRISRLASATVASLLPRVVIHVVGDSAQSNQYARVRRQRRSEARVMDPAVGPSRVAGILFEIGPSRKGGSDLGGILGNTGRRRTAVAAVRLECFRFGGKQCVACAIGDGAERQKAIGVKQAVTTGLSHRIEYEPASIVEAIRRWIKELKAEGELRVEPCVDHDTKNVPESPDIAATIVEKIEACALFVCDVSIINKGATSRLTPNPNVLIEMGYAVKSRGWKRVVCVFNEATGSIEDLPFDLRHRRVRAYRLDDGQEKAEVRKLLAQLLKADLQAAFSFTQVTKDRSDADNLLPSVEVLSAALECQPPVATPTSSHVHHPRPQYLEGRLVWTLTASLFLDAKPGESLSVALHRCTGWMNDRFSGKQIPLTEIAVQSEPRSQVSVDDAVILIRGPGRLSIQARCETPFRDSGYPDIVQIELRLPVAERDGTPIALGLEVSQTPYGGDWPIRWSKRDSSTS